MKAACRSPMVTGVVRLPVSAVPKSWPSEVSCITLKMTLVTKSLSDPLVLYTDYSRKAHDPRPPSHFLLRFQVLFSVINLLDFAFGKPLFW